MSISKGDERLKTAYEEGRRALDLQSRSIDELRSRASSLATVAGVSVAFLTGLALRDGREAHVATTVTIVAFGLLVLAVAFIMVPRIFTLTNDPKMLVEQWIDDQDRDVNETYRHLALFYGTHCRLNEKKLKLMHWAAFAATSLLGVAVVAAVIDLGGRR